MKESQKFKFAHVAILGITMRIYTSDFIEIARFATH